MCGRRWGKTGAGLLAVTKGHGSRWGRRRGALQGGNIWWVAPTFTIGSIIWRQVKRALEPITTRSSEQEHRVEIYGGGSVTVRSSDNPDSLRGDGLDGLVCDEGAFLQKEAWTESLRPALSDKRGWAMFLTTPNGQNWFYDDLWMPGQLNPQWACWQRPTKDNPLIDDDELHQAFMEVGPRAFSQEYEANFVLPEGSEFPAEYFTDKVFFSEWPHPRDVVLRVMTLDPSLGKTDKSDFSAWTMLMLDKDGVMWCDADIERRDANQMIKDGLDIAGWFNPHAIGIESNQFQSVLVGIFNERAKFLGKLYPVWEMFNTLNKRVRVRTMTPYLARGDIRFKRGSRGAYLMVSQFKGFPTDKHDDGPDALEMNVRLTREIFEERGKAA